MILKNILINTSFSLILGFSLSTVSELGAQTLTGSPDYSSGMTAYMKGDFESAKQQWLSAAQANDAKAMFNLGLLHERQKISGASQERAEQWFAQAGNAGYAPADYHLALKLADRGNTSGSNQLLRRAADAGFVLAEERLGIAPTVSITPASTTPSSTTTSSSTTAPTAKTVSQATQSQVSQVSSPVARVAAVPTTTDAASISKQQRSYNRESWLLAKSPESWTIQMLAFSDEAKVRDFIDDHGLHRNAAYFAEGKPGSIVYKLVYGSYASKQQADDARGKFTTALKEHGPWLRPLKAVQILIKQR